MDILSFLEVGDDVADGKEIIDNIVVIEGVEL